MEPRRSRAQATPFLEPCFGGMGGDALSAYCVSA